SRPGFFFQAEDGIRDFHVTGVQTCALPIFDDFARYGTPYLSEDFEYDAAAVAKHWKDGDTAPRLQALHDAFASLDDWSEASLETALRGLADGLGVGAGKLIHPLRVALVGQAVSPGIFEVAVVLGRERVLGRIGRALRELAARGCRHAAGVFCRRRRSHAGIAGRCRVDAAGARARSRSARGRRGAGRRRDRARRSHPG